MSLRLYGTIAKRRKRAIYAFMEMTSWLSIFALLFSSGNLVFLLWDHFRARHQAALATNLAALANVDLVIKDVPSVLRFHDITEQDLDDAGVTASEIAYLAATFHTGRIYYSLVGNDHLVEPFDETDTYRYHLCNAQATQRAWPLLKRFLMDSPYKNRVKLTIEKAALRSAKN